MPSLTHTDSAVTNIRPSMVGTLKQEVLSWLLWFIDAVPGRIGFALRRRLYQRLVPHLGKRAQIARHVELSTKNLSIGDDFIVMSGSVLRSDAASNLIIGHRVSLNTNVTLDATPAGQITILNDVLIGQNVVIRASNHTTSERQYPIRSQGHTPGKIIIEEGVWICANAVITNNVKIGKHSVVAAGAVVTRDIPPYSVVGGGTAMHIRSR